MKTNQSKFRKMFLIVASAVLVGCQTPPSAPNTTGSPKMPPDYELPESQFVLADFNKLASEFLDEYAGQYVVFNGRYLQTAQGALIYDRGRPFAVDGFMTGMIGGPRMSGLAVSPRTLNVLWFVEDRELGRPFLNLQLNAPVKIYAYVLPARTQARVKSRQDRFMKGLPVPVVLLIKAVPLASQ